MFGNVIHSRFIILWLFQTVSSFYFLPIYYYTDWRREIRRKKKTSYTASFLTLSSHPRPFRGGNRNIHLILHRFRLTVTDYAYPVVHQVHCNNEVIRTQQWCGNQGEGSQF